MPLSHLLLLGGGVVHFKLVASFVFLTQTILSHSVLSKVSPSFYASESLSQSLSKRCRGKTGIGGLLSASSLL